MHSYFSIFPQVSNLHVSDWSRRTTYTLASALLLVTVFIFLVTWNEYEGWMWQRGQELVFGSNVTNAYFAFSFITMKYIFAMQIVLFDCLFVCWVYFWKIGLLKEAGLSKTPNAIKNWKKNSLAYFLWHFYLKCNSLTAHNQINPQPTQHLHVYSS